MQGRTKTIVTAYAWPLAWVLAGFLAAEALRALAVAATLHWPAVLAVWVSLLVLLAAVARALWVSWRLWRGRGGTLPPAGAGP